MRKVVEGNNLFKIMQGKFGKYDFEVGILENKPHYAPERGTNLLDKGALKWYSYAGLHLLKWGDNPDGTLYSVARDLDKAFKWLRRPFTSRKNADVLNVMNSIIADLNGKPNKQRIINGIQAIVRNPILRGDYGKNSPKTAKKKGFNKLMMATGQFFRNIKARLTNV